MLSFNHDAQRIDESVAGAIQENENRQAKAVSPRPEQLGMIYSDSKLCARVIVMVMAP